MKYADMAFLPVIWPLWSYSIPSTGRGGELRSGLFGEMRAIKNGHVEQHFEPLTGDGVRTIVTIAEQFNQAGWDTYYGVLPRIRERGRSEDCVDRTSVLWADIDAKHFSPDLATGKRAALDVLSGVSPYPNIVVDSGGGVHAYWLLRRSVALTEAASAMRGLARATGGDAVHDAARVLRLPGTLNWKREPPTHCRVLSFRTATTFSISDFESYMFTRDFPPRSAGAVPRTDELPSWLVNLISVGAPRGSRSEAVFSAVLGLLNHGRTDDEVRSIIRTNPIGEKYQEMNPVAAERWLDRTIRRARELLV